MSDVSQGVGWWQASDGLWYPPKESDEAPEPGWWLAADGRWYPPVESVDPPEPGWWLAADGRWYPPESLPADHVDEPAYQPRRLAAEDAVAVEDAVSVEDAVAVGVVDVEPEMVAGGDATESSAGEPPAGGPAPEHVAHGPVAHDPDDAHGSDDDPPTGIDEATDARGPRRPMSVADRPPRTVEAVSTRAAAARPRPADASQQIRRRDDASREDAIAQASARFMAASRALKFLEADIEDNREHPGMSAARSTARAAQAEATGAGPETTTAPTIEVPGATASTEVA
ncbi:MAG: hypothetical protein ACXV95_10100, partial [Acidimicrobiales bacterium]